MVRGGRFAMRRGRRSIWGGIAILAGGMIILTLILPLIASVIGVPISFFLTHWISRTLQSEAFATYSIVRSAVSMISFLAAPVIPLFAASAGIIRYRFKNAAQ